jgi:uncharacterized tellurite resistance protein B-like protein
MLQRFLRPAAADTDSLADGVDPGAVAAGETATVRRIVGRLASMPPERARLLAAAAYTLARAAHADLHIDDDETRLMEQILQEHGEIDEATAVIVVEMAKLQTLTVGGIEDYSVTREFARLATHDQKLDVLRACFAIGAVSDDISAEENAVANQIAKELQLDTGEINAVRSEFHDRLSVVRAQRRLLGQS